MEEDMLICIIFYSDAATYYKTETPLSQNTSHFSIPILNTNLKLINLQKVLSNLLVHRNLLSFIYQNYGKHSKELCKANRYKQSSSPQYIKQSHPSESLHGYCKSCFQNVYRHLLNCDSTKITVYGSGNGRQPSKQVYILSQGSYF